MVVSDLGGDAVRAELTVESDNWMSALRKGRAELGEQGGVPGGSSCAVAADGTVTILDPVERRRFMIAPAAAKPVGLRIPADEVPRPASTPPAAAAPSSAPTSHAASSPPASHTASISSPPKASSYVPPPPSAPPATGPAPAKKVGKQTVAYIPAGAIPAAAPLPSTDPAPVPRAPAPEAIGPASAAPSPAVPVVVAPAPSTPIAPPAAEPAVASAAKKRAKMTVAYMPGAEALSAPTEVVVGSSAPAPAAMASVPAATASAPAPSVPSQPASPPPARVDAVESAHHVELADAASPEPADVTDKHAAIVERNETTEGSIGAGEWKLLARRDADPTPENPLCYRERSYLVPEGLSGADAEALARARVDELRELLREAPPGRFVNVAVFDHVWTDRPSRPPAATAQWKDWQGDVVVDRPLERWLASTRASATPSSAPAASASTAPATPASPTSASPTSTAPAAPSPASTEPVAQPAVVAPASRPPAAVVPVDEPRTAPPARTRRTTDDHDSRLADAFEACQDLFFLGTPAEGLEFAVELLGQLVPHEAASACLYDIDEDVLRFVVATGPGGHDRRGDGVPARLGLFGIAARLVGTTLRVDPLGSDARFDPGVDGRVGLDPQNALYLPIAHQGRILGVLQLLNRELDVTFSQGDADLGLYVANQLGQFLQQVRMRPRR
jgi:hypothetical protein